MTSRTIFAPGVAERVLHVIERVARESDIQSAVEANHDQNRWWPTTVTDWRLRMTVAGWSTRISYNMVTTYARVVEEADRLGYDQLTELDDDKLLILVAPLGLRAARLRYFRSLTKFLDEQCAASRDPLTMNADTLIAQFAANVEQAGYKVAQCAALYARGYHTGIVPVDSGMVTKLAPCLGMHFGCDALAHEAMRSVLEACVATHASQYRHLTQVFDYNVNIPADVSPTWWVHLVLIYFKRLYCNQPNPRLCPQRPLCAAVLDCDCPSPAT